LDKDMAAESTAIAPIIPTADDEDPFEILGVNTSNDVHNFALEKKAVSLFRYEALQKIFPETDFIDIQPFVNTQRKKKSRFEVDKIKHSIKIIEKVLKEGIKKVKPGMTESELTGELEYQIGRASCRERV